MKQRNWTFLFYVATLSLLFSYENKFSYNSSTGNKISLSHSPELIDIEGGYTRLAKMGEGHTVEPGMPELPHFSTYFQLDPTKTYDFQFEILESYIIEDITIMPHQNMDKWEVNAVSIINETVYDSYEPLPEVNMVVSERMQGRGVEFVSINVTPYKYYPKYKRLEVYTEIDIQIIETGENPNGELRQPKRSRIFDEFYKDLIVNFEYSDRDDDYQAQAILYICGGNSLDNSYVQDLIEWRHKQGYIVYTASESEVGGSSASTSEIKNYISDAYYNWENPPEIVGLIGDTGGSYSLPKYDHSWGGYGGPTDFDYTQLDGGDMIPEVFIGRISGSTSSEINNIINKTIHYEKADNVDDIWFSKAGLVGDPDESGNSTIFTNQYIENLMINHGMNRVQTDYDGSGTQTFMEQQFNAGILYYNYRGWYNGAGSDPTSSINNGYDTPFVTTITCGTGDYDGTSPSENFVRLGSVNNPKGAVGAIGMATTGTHTAYNNIVDMGIYDGIFSKKLWYAGAAAAAGDLAIVATYTTLGASGGASSAEAHSKWSNLIGDPALHLWTATPTNFNFSHPTTIPLGTTMQEFNIIDENGNAVEGARVTLLMGDDIIFITALTDGNGQVTLSWDAVEAGHISLTVMKRNYRPYEGMIEISTAAGAAVAVKQEDMYVNSGEEIDLSINLHNYGRDSANDVKVELNSTSEHITIIDDIINIGNIEPDHDASLSAQVYVHGTAFHMEEMDLKLTITDADDNIWINSVPLNVMGPYLVVSDYHGDIFPGSNTNMVLNMVNQGSKKVDDYLLEILPFENIVSVQSSSVTINELFVDENIYLDDFELSFSEDIINGTVLPLELILTSSDGYTRSHILNVTVGEVRETDPLGPDTYGYYIYDSGDTDYDEAPVYDWIEIAEGLGSQVSITDAGNGNSSYTASTDDRTLPFPFTFYGKEYNTIQINTNGWISFGNFEMNAFRNYPIPGAGGPSPMIAAFWDDLRTGSGGYVYYYESPDFVVIQWDDMRICGILGGGWYSYQCTSSIRNTFQMILYPSNEIKIQYQDFNNESNGYYSGTPSHGCYSTIGIENHLGDIGLQYTFNNTYPEAAATLQDGSAIFITTRVESSYILGDLNDDGIVNILDVVLLVNIVLGNEDFNPAGDMNTDGLINVLDVVILVNAILNP
ncbi:hypothetical protein EB821_04570 [Candidatus Marinimicrobia bacterium PRS2]|nr:hypothetical protein EB821_04570 [Candidatus Marinimicrobia bacterium PRS2]